MVHRRALGVQVREDKNLDQAEAVAEMVPKISALQNQAAKQCYAMLRVLLLADFSLGMCSMSCIAAGRAASFRGTSSGHWNHEAWDLCLKAHVKWKVNMTQTYSFDLVASLAFLANRIVGEPVQCIPCFVFPSLSVTLRSLRKSELGNVISEARTRSSAFVEESSRRACFQLVGIAENVRHKWRVKWWTAP